MKIRLFSAITVALFFSVLSYGAQHSSTSEPIIISGTRFTYPLIEKWIAAYANVNPQVKIVLASKSMTQSPELTIIAHQPATGELQSDQEIVYAGKYALLPVTNNYNPNLELFTRKGLSKKEIDKLFFEVIDYESDEPVKKSNYRATIYSRDNKACTSTALASYFGHTTSDIRGKKLFGDDVFLLTAIRKDSIALTFNPLSYLFDNQSRQIKDGLRILPIELKKDTRILLSGNLDEVIAVLEQNKIETIPVEKIGFVYKQQIARRELTDFLKWVLTEGQQYNHSAGFLNTDKSLLSEQLNRLSEHLLTLK